MLRWGVKTALPNTQKQTQGGCQIEETKKMAQIKEQIKAPEKIQLFDEEIANRSDAQFKTLVIRMLTEMVEYSLKIEKKNEGYAK